MNRFLNVLLLFFLSVKNIKGSALFKRHWGQGGRQSKTRTNSLNTTKVSNNNSEYRIPEWQKSLPHPLPTRRTLERIHIPLSSNTKVTVYLLGTSHVSNDSSADVRVLLNATRPQIVFLELCDQRINMLAPPPPPPSLDENETTKNAFPSNASFWDRVQLVRQRSGMSHSSAMGTVLLTSVQDEYAESLGVELGGEFHAAWEYCQVHRPICILGDRPLQITLLRAWESLSWWGKTKCLLALLWSSWQKPNPEELREWMQSILQGDSDVLTESMAELRKSFPSLERVILKERDAYLACKIFQTCRHLDYRENHTMVAIVGAGHGKGICQWLTDGNGQTPEQILSEIVQTKKHTDVDFLVKEVTQLPYGQNLF
ncbi:TraB-like protein [Fragilaria crotonensis]|nr:TraB-like protein [Fragilaria crotonensis]